MVAEEIPHASDIQHGAKVSVKLHNNEQWGRAIKRSYFKVNFHFIHPRKDQAHSTDVMSLHFLILHVSFQSAVLALAIPKKSIVGTKEGEMIVERIWKDGTLRKNVWPEKRRE